MMNTGSPGTNAGREAPCRETLTVQECAVILGLSRGLTYQLAREGKLPGVLRYGRRLVVSRRALEKALESGGTEWK